MLEPHRLFDAARVPISVTEADHLDDGVLEELIEPENP